MSTKQQVLTDILLQPYFYMDYKSGDLLAVYYKDERIGTITLSRDNIGISLEDTDKIPLHTSYNTWSLFEAIEVLIELNYKN